jgi:hypothetical protein
MLLLAGCASAPTAEQIAQADYGPYPDNYEQITRSFFNSVLKDPSSLQIDGSISSPQKSWLSFMGSVQYGYKVCVRYNAKNSYGGYGGFTTEYLLIRNGVVVQNIDKADRVGAAMGISLC